MDEHEDELVREGIVIEGMRPPLTRSQRTLRLAIGGAAVAVVLAVILWPTMMGALATIAPAAAANSPRSQPFSYRQIGIATATVITSWGLPVQGNACPMTVVRDNNGLDELHATTLGSGDVWALLLSSAPLAVGQDEDIVWRVTGSGAFHVFATDRMGINLIPSPGPDPHLTSTWNRPGDEWGTVFNFPHAGCWQFVVTRGEDVRSNLWLLVES